MSARQRCEWEGFETDPDRTMACGKQHPTPLCARSVATGGARLKKLVRCKAQNRPWLVDQDNIPAIEAAARFALSNRTIWRRGTRGRGGSYVVSIFDAREAPHGFKIIYTLNRVAA